MREDLGTLLVLVVVVDRGVLRVNLVVVAVDRGVLRVNLVVVAVVWEILRVNPTEGLLRQRTWILRDDETLQRSHATHR